jgi:hypothetical protein
MPNPLVAQGTLNRVRASVIWPSFPTLNVTAPYLGRAGITLALEGQSTVFLPTMTGAVTSAEPYVMTTLTMHLLKSQGIAGLYKAQMELNALIGDCVVRADSTTLPPYQIINCAIASVAELRFAGDDADFAVSCRGYYLLNSSMFD